MAKELHHSTSSPLLEKKEPLNDIPEDNEEATTPSEDRVLTTSELINSRITTMPAIQIEVTCDDSDIVHKTLLSAIPEVQITSDDGSDNDALNENGIQEIYKLLKISNCNYR